MQKMFLLFLLFLMILIPISLLALPKTYFDEGAAVCLSVVFLDTECPACGLTRACMRFIHFDFIGAYYFNKMSIIATPFSSWILTGYFIKTFKQWKALS
jgi:Protein of unknown function (DUF2752)